MQSHELLREVLKTSSAKQVAADLGLSLSMIYKWAEPDEGTGSGLSFVVGQKSGDTWPGFSGFIDAIVLDVDGLPAQDVNLTLVETMTATAGTPQSADAGFVFDGDSNALSIKEDDHSKNVFDPAIRGKTDRFMMRFKKPA